MTENNDEKKFGYTVDDLAPDLDKLLAEDNVEVKEEVNNADKDDATVEEKTVDKQEVEENLPDITPVIEEVKNSIADEVEKIDKEIDELKNMTDDDIIVDIIADNDELNDDDIKKKLEEKKRNINIKLSVLSKKRAELEAKLAVEATKKIIEEYVNVTKDNELNYEVACEIFSKLNDEEKKKFNELNQKHPFKALDFIREKLYLEKGVKKVDKKENDKDIKTPTRIDDIRGGSASREQNSTIGGFSQKDYREMGIV